MTDKNKIIIHGCGGAGTNITHLLTTTLNDQYSGAEGFPVWKDLYFDTTDKNVANLDIDTDTKFFKVKPKEMNSTGIDGSAGDRSSNYHTIRENVADYLNEHGFLGPKMGEFHIVIHSAGGGSGSVIGPLLSRAMIERGIPTVVITVGDSSTGMLARNTNNTITTLATMAKQSKKPFTIFYTNNEDMDGETRQDRMHRANSRILTFTTILSIFLSGQNFDLDNRDMEAFLDFTKHATLAKKLRPGLYTVEVIASNHDGLDESINVIMGRTLTKPQTPARDDYELLDRKVGQVVANDALQVIGESLPIDLLLASGQMTIEQNRLTEVIEEFDRKASGFRPDHIEVDDESEIMDDGMVL